MTRWRVIALGAALVVMLGLAAWLAPIAAQEKSAAPVDQARIEQYLQKIFSAQSGGRIIVEPERRPSPVPGLEEVRFVVEAAGMRRPGVVYLAGDTLIMGQMVDLSTERNLTGLGLGPPTKITYRPDQFDLKGRTARGNASAPLTLIEYSDFQCPFCKQQHQTLQTLMAKYPGQVRLYYKHFPLTNIHPLAYAMALAAECARDQKEDAFWSLHDHFFVEQYTGSDTGALMERLRRWAGEAGLNGDRLATCVETREHAARVDADLQEGRRLGVTGTPAVIANGEFLNGAQPLAVFERYLEPAKK
ncbi:MAG: DsbA family protein [Nitrospirota bacterium]